MSNAGSAAPQRSKVMNKQHSLTSVFLNIFKHEFFVDMTCEGCSNAVTRVLHRLGGESSCRRCVCHRQLAMAAPALGLDVAVLWSFILRRKQCVQFDIDLPNKKVYIDSEHNVDTLLETLKKTGKSASYLGEKSAQ
ncbi:copper transport protein ATOX1 isoform X1 [Cygnus olor]|uniref:copper transport protein ATOX1 isoform X1 n=1 Tax=Cygnus olor TaxID=8869 RepID=UPI001ADE3A47|nr:copper transport protein ATOX1 isoform X1 [Cygnus olor]